MIKNWIKDTKDAGETLHHNLFYNLLLRLL